MARRAADYIAGVERRLGVEPGGAPVDGLWAVRQACIQIAAHPQGWQWTGGQEGQIPTVVGQDYVVLPSTVLSVQRVQTQAGYADTEIPVPELAMWTRFEAPERRIGDSWGYYGLNWREIDGVLRRTMEFGVDEEESRVITVWTKHGVVPPDTDRDGVGVPPYLELALQELANAIAEGTIFPESGSVSARCAEVWNGEVMAAARRIDGQLSAGMVAPVAAGAVETDGLPYYADRLAPRYNFP